MLVLFVVLKSLCAFSQPANDECGGAITVPVNSGDGCTQSVTSRRQFSTQSKPPCVTTGFAALDVWFKFIATATTHKVTLTSTSYRDHIFEVYSGTCSNLTSITCVNTGGLGEQDMTLLSNLTPGNTYYIRVYDRYANDDGDFTLCVNSATSLIPNDECTGAATVPVTASPDFSVNYTTLGATQSMAGCFGVAEDDIWFKFTATTPRHRIWVSRASDAMNVVVEVFTGNCGGLTSIGCFVANGENAFRADLSNLTPGTTYYFRVYGQDANTVRTDVRCSVIPLPNPPANDECSGAISLPVNADDGCTLTVTGNRQFSTQSKPPCVNTVYAALDVWFKFTATASIHKVTLTSQAYRNHIFEVYSGTCNNLTSIACVNTGGLGEQEIALLTNLTPGNTYYIRVYDWYSNDDGDFTLCVNSATSLLVNDECAGAVTVPVSATPSFSQPYTTVGATQSQPGCFGEAEDDIWFKFTATNSRHRIWVSMGSDAMNPVVEVFKGSCTNLTSVGCFVAHGDNGFRADASNLTPGTLYYYRVYGQSANSVRTDVRTTVVPLPPVPANDECSGAITLPVNSDGSCTQTYTGNRQYSTQSMPPCVNTVYAALDVWFKFTATATSHRITLTTQAYRDHIFEVYSGSCSSLTSIACVNVGGLGEQEMMLLTNLIPGNTYYIRVYDWYSNDDSDFSLCINTAPSFLTNDECTGAVSVPVSATPAFSTPYTTLGATQSMPGCFGVAEDDIWFRFTATASRHRIWISMTNDAMNPVIEVFKGSCSGLTSLGCFYTNDINPASLLADVSNLTPGLTYYYRVYGKTANSVRTSIQTTVVSLPSTPVITLSGPSVFCAGGNVILTSSATSNNQWFKNDVIITGATGATFIATESGSYTVRYKDNTSELFSTPVIITVTALPVKPVITQTGNTLTSSSATGNQWVLNNIPIIGATNQIFIATTTGLYTVQVTQNGCSAQSDQLNFVLTSLVDPALWNYDVTIFPNPVLDKVYIKNQSARRLQVRVFDIRGTIVYDAQSTYSLTIPMKKFSNGVYVFLITDIRRGETISKTIVKR